MSINARVEKTVSTFKSIDNWEERYKKLIGLGKELLPMAAEFQIEDNKVRGCQSQVWLFAELVDGKIIYYADSDASIAKGVVALLINIYSGGTPEEILECPENFIDEIGLKQHLSMSRANGLASMLKQIKVYAFAYQTKIKMGLV